MSHEVILPTRLRGHHDNKILRTVPNEWQAPDVVAGEMTQIAMKAYALGREHQAEEDQAALEELLARLRAEHHG